MSDRIPLSDEDLTIDDQDLNEDLFADDVEDELDFDFEVEREYEEDTGWREFLEELDKLPDVEDEDDLE